MFLKDGHRLVFRYDAEILWIEPWGPDALRVRATKQARMPEENWALQIPVEAAQVDKAAINIADSEASITHGSIRAVISQFGKVMIYNISTGKVLLEEYARNRSDLLDPKCSSLQIEAREFAPIPGTDNYRLSARFESLDPKEKLFGMGQYQQPYLDLKGLDLELAHRNSQASVPFVVSSRGYGLLWNNPSVGRVTFGKHVATFEAYSTTTLDYWIATSSTGQPRQLLETYTSVTGRVPMMPEYGLGFWQCKLRYQTQEELLEVAREYKRRDLPIDVIVCDFFHWPLQGEWKFDPTYWPSPDDMIRELQDLKIELMVSIWPTVDKRSENYDEMVTKGLLIRTDRGIRTAMNFEGETVHFDATNPEARGYIWQKAKKNYYSKGIRTFWLDEAEPEYNVYDFDNYRYHLGSNLRIGNLYPLGYAQAFYEGMTKEGETNIVNLLRCAWAGSQRFGALVWSGDIASSWSSFRCQLVAGLNMGLAGIPWWTTDIGGFHGGDPNDDKFRELFVRWFQWAAFCPVMRLHGDREPRQPQQGTTGGATCCSGAPNEVWSYGEDVYRICVKYMKIREDLRDYTRSLMKEAHERGTPVIRPCFYDFPEDQTCWSLEDQYMYGPKYLCAPVLAPGDRKRTLYLPPGRWSKLGGDSGVQDGGREIEVDAPMDTMPVFVRQDSSS